MRWSRAARLASLLTLSILVTLGLAVGQQPGAPPAPRDPREELRRRFLNNEDRYGSVRKTIRGSGHRDGASYSVFHEAEAKFRVRVDTSRIAALEGYDRMMKSGMKVGVPPEVAAQMEKMRDAATWVTEREHREPGEPDTARAVVTDRSQGSDEGHTAISGDETSFSWSRDGHDDKEGKVHNTLMIDVAKGTYTLACDPQTDVVEVTEIDASSEYPTRKKVSPWSATDGLLVHDEPLPGEGLVLSGTKKLTKAAMQAHMARNGTVESLRGTLTWTLSPVLLEDVELLLEPLVPANYDAWRPKGSLVEDEPGANITAKATLQRKGGGVPKDKARRIRFALDQVTTEPGVCINYPWIPTRPEKPDLRFRPQINYELKVSDDLTAVRVGKDLTTANVVVSSYDYGASGLLEVTAELESGRFVTGVLKSDRTRDAMRFPKSKDDSRIADVWRDKVSYKGADDTDDDDTPAGDGNAGDGLTAYEEYRGFMDGGAWSDSDPGFKDFFVVDEVKGDSKVAIRKFAEATGLIVHHELTKMETNLTRVVNFNHELGPSHVDQHAVLMRRYYAQSISAALGGPGRPKDIVQIAVATAGADGLGGATIHAMAHELCHCCNIWHHGEVDTRKELWTIEKDAAGKRVAYHAVLDLDGVPLKIDPTPIHLFKESAPTVEYEPPGAWTAMVIYVADPNGQHSGDEDCLMRYNCAAVARRGPNEYYWVFFTELDGFGLCSTTQGHDVNKPGRTPQPRYWGADAVCKRGNCQKQLCVNDGAFALPRPHVPGRHPKDPQ